MAAAPRSTRRDFLQGKAAADALVDLAAEVGESLPAADNAPDAYLLKLARRAMACQFEFFFNAGQYPDAGELGLLALDLVDRLEDQLTVFREHSELSRLNRHAAEEPIEAEPRLFQLLQQVVVSNRETGGAYDVTAGPLSRVWGFTDRAGAVPNESELLAARQRVGSQWLALDEARRTVRFTRPGMEINLGSIGKGYALDRCAELLETAGIHAFLLHGGASSVLARGNHAATGPEGGWLVGVPDPLRPRRRLGQLRVVNRALATSGAGVQFFVDEEKRYGHILDPRSGLPAEGVVAATVLAPTAAEADALSTAFYVMGPAGAGEYCAGHPQIAAILLCPGTRHGSLNRHAFGLQDGDWIEGDSSGLV
ncbi:MAG: FAD:protein FMN transferase [Pirellulales bacterium]